MAKSRKQMQSYNFNLFSGELRDLAAIAWDMLVSSEVS